MGYFLAFFSLLIDTWQIATKPQERPSPFLFIDTCACRVFNVLKNWVDHYYEDLDQDQELEDSLVAFVTASMENFKAVQKAAQQVLNS